MGFLVAGRSGVIYPPFGTERKVDVDTGIEVLQENIKTPFPLCVFFEATFLVFLPRQDGPEIVTVFP